jgi:hypothetical protein
VVTLTAVVAEPAQVLRLGSGQLRAALTAQPPLKDLVVRAFLLRRSILLGLAADLKIVGHSGGPDVERLRAHAEAAGLNCTVVDLGEDDGATTLLEDLGVSPDELPVVLFRDGPVLRNPSVQELDAVVRERGAG